MAARSDIAAEIRACETMCDQLKQQIKTIRNSSGPSVLQDCNQGGDEDEFKVMPIERKMCTGHFGKIYALHWGTDSNYLVTASQDGKLIIWNAHSGNKQLAVTLSSSWVMTCCFSPNYTFVASGGLDNTVTIFRVAGTEGAKFQQKDRYGELEKHDGYLSCARFLNEQEILSASGDGTIILWDAESRQPKNIFVDHAGDVMFVSLNNQEKNLFVSGSVDATARVWDLRSDSSVGVFPGHEADVNTVCWYADGYSIVSGSDDGTVRLFDMRSWRQLSVYLNKHNRSLHCPDPAGVTAVDVSQSGSCIFSAYDNGHVYCWNTLTAECDKNLPHDTRVSSLGVSPDGYALATGCWDFHLRIFA